MTIPVTLLTWGGAALPIILLLFLLVGRRWSAVEAAAIGAGTAFIVASTVYSATLDVIGTEIGKGVWNSVSIIAVIIPAVLIYEISYETKAFSAIQQELTRLIPDKLLQVLTMGWCFTSFLQGPSGFGVPVAVAAPLLIGIGVRPFWAVMVPLMAHAWGNTFGTLGLGWEALVQQTSLEGDMVAYWSAALWTGILTGFLCVFSGAAICFFYGGLRGLRHGWPAVLVLGTIMAGGQLVLSQLTPTLSLVIPSTLALGAAFFLARLPRYRNETSLAKTSPMLDLDRKSDTEKARLTLNEAMLPYYILVGISVIVLLTPPINSFLSAWKVSFSFPETVTRYGFTNKAYAVYGPVSWLTHSGFFLLVASLLAYGYFSARNLMPAGGLGRVLVNTLKKSVPSAISVVLLLIMSKIMTGSGQVAVLAAGTAEVTGQNYVFLAPFVGMLGSFMSSSNVSSNILFGQFQENMGLLTGKKVALLLAAQTSGATIGTMFSPSKVLLGTTTAGIVGQEGAIIKKLIGIALIAATVMGLITLVFA